VTQPPLTAANQKIAAERLTDAFASVCFSATEAPAAARALEGRGWPRMNVVWAQPGSDRATCVGHFPAADDAAMLEAMEKRWGASGEGPDIVPKSRAWTFVMKDGALTPAAAASGSGGPPTAAALAALQPGEALVYLQVAYNPVLHDVASLAAVSRPAAK
jgi:hypothetical protein